MKRCSGVSRPVLLHGDVPALLRTEGLTKLYGRQTALDRVSFFAAPGEVLGLIGPNVIAHPLIEVKSSVKSGTWRKVGSKPVQWVFGIRSVTFQKKRSKLLREWPHDWHRADNYFHRRSASTLA